MATERTRAVLAAAAVGAILLAYGSSPVVVSDPGRPFGASRKDVSTQRRSTDRVTFTVAGRQQGQADPDVPRIATLSEAAPRTRESARTLWVLAHAAAKRGKLADSRAHFTRLRKEAA